MVTIGRVENNFALYPIIIKIGAINSAITAIIKVGNSPMPIGFPKLGLAENKFNNLGYP